MFFFSVGVIFLFIVIFVFVFFSFSSFLKMRVIVDAAVFLVNVDKFVLI